MGTYKSEYMDEYCSAPGGTKAAEQVPLKETCGKSYDKQPIGGKNQAARDRALQEASLPVYDADFVATVYSESERGTHRIQPHWRDHRWTEPMRAENSSLYEPADRDPANRNNFYVYRTTSINPYDTPCKPLTVPDVHKLRYMHNNYMCGDDWY